MCIFVIYAYVLYIHKYMYINLHIYICVYTYLQAHVITKTMCSHPDYHHNGFDNIYIS